MNEQLAPCGVSVAAPVLLGLVPGVRVLVVPEVAYTEVAHAASTSTAMTTNRSICVGRSLVVVTKSVSRRLNIGIAMRVCGRRFPLFAAIAQSTGNRI